MILVVMINIINREDDNHLPLYPTVSGCFWRKYDEYSGSFHSHKRHYTSPILPGWCHHLFLPAVQVPRLHFSLPFRFLAKDQLFSGQEAYNEYSSILVDKTLIPNAHSSFVLKDIENQLLFAILFCRSVTPCLLLRSRSRLTLVLNCHVTSH